MVVDSDDKIAEASRNNSASPTTDPSSTVSLHPLIIMNIFEHWTRIATQNGSPQHGNYKHVFSEARKLTSPLFRKKKQIAFHHLVLIR